VSGEAAPDAAPDLSRRLARRIVPWAIRRRRPLLWCALAISVAGAILSGFLYSDLRSDIEELLPATAPSVVAARTVAPKLHSVIHLSVVLEGTVPEGLQRIADLLASRLRALPPSLVSSVEYRIDAQEAFLRRHGGLYLSIGDLEEIQRRIDRRIAWEKRRANPLLDILGEGQPAAEPAPPLDFADVEGRIGAAGAALARFRDGYFQTPDGRLLVLLVRPPEQATGVAANRALLDAVKREVAAVEPARYDPGVRVGYDGEVATVLEEQESLAEDLVTSTAVVLVLVLLSLWVYFRRWRSILAIAASLAAGCALTFGLSELLVGYLNANTAFLGSIVVGNGINVSIIFTARYLEERRRGEGLEESLARSFEGTLAATFVASFAAGLSYLSLAVTDFRGFSHFGLIGGLGMALCWAVAYLLLPPLIAVLDRGNPGVPAHRMLVGGLAADLAERHGRAVRIASAALLLASAAAVLSYRGPVVEHDLDRLRSARGARSGSQHWGHKVDEVFQAYLTPIVIRAESPEALAPVLAELERARSLAGGNDPVREVRTLASAVPPDQAEKLPPLARLRETLSDARLERLGPELRARARAWRPPADLRAFTLDDLPTELRLPLVERDGSSGRIALVFPRKVGVLGPDELHELVMLVRGAIARSGAPAVAVGQALLFADISSAILEDGPRATALAFSAVVLLVAATLRRWRPVALVIASLLLGVAWLVGAAALFRVRFNFLNFVVLPITFGIGVDYAVNIVQRWRREPDAPWRRVLGETGGAVALCSLTTIIGYASLLVADSRALRGFGLLASVGELTCIGAALVALPAWLRAWQRGGRRAPGEPPGHGPDASLPPGRADAPPAA